MEEGSKQTKHLEVTKDRSLNAHFQKGIAFKQVR
jgi:hypothetical protein